MTRESAVKWITIDGDADAVFADLIDPCRHPGWATGFFAGEARPGAEPGEAIVTLAATGRPVRLKVTGDRVSGNLAVAFAQGNGPYAPPAQVRLCPNGSGVDVVWVIKREPHTPDPQWAGIQATLQRALEGLKRAHEPIPRETP